MLSLHLLWRSVPGQVPVQSVWIQHYRLQLPLRMHVQVSTAIAPATAAAAVAAAVATVAAVSAYNDL